MRIHEINPEETIDEGWYYDEQGTAKFDPHKQVHGDVLDPIALVNATHVRNNYLLGAEQTATPRTSRIKITVDLDGPPRESFTTEVQVISAFKVILDKIVGYTLWKEIKRGSVDPAALDEFMDLTLSPIQAMLTSLFTGPVDMIVSPGSMQQFNALYLKKLKDRLGLLDDQVFVGGLDKRVLVMPGETNDRKNALGDPIPPIQIGATGAQQEPENVHAIMQALRTYRDPASAQLEVKRIPHSVGNLRLRDNIKRFVYADNRVQDRLLELLTRPRSAGPINIVIVDDDMYMGSTMTASAREIYYTAADLLADPTNPDSLGELAEILKSTIRIVGVTSLYNVPTTAYTNPTANQSPEDVIKKNPTFVATEPAVNRSRAINVNLFLTNCDLDTQGFSLTAPQPFQLDSANFAQQLEVAQKYSVLNTLLTGSLSDIETKLPNYFFQRQFLEMFSAPVAFAVIHLLKQRNRTEILNKFAASTRAQITRSYDQVLDCYQQKFPTLELSELINKITAWAQASIERFNVVQRVEQTSKANQQRVAQRQASEEPNQLRAQRPAQRGPRTVLNQPWLDYITKDDVNTCRSRVKFPQASIAEEFLRKFNRLAQTVASGFEYIATTSSFFSGDWIEEYPSTPRAYDKNSEVVRNVFMGFAMWAATMYRPAEFVNKHLDQLKYVWQDAESIAAAAAALAMELQQKRGPLREYSDEC